MEEEFKRIYDCMRASETVADGEYFVIHADHLHDFEMAIGNYFDENKLIEKIDPLQKDWTTLDDIKFTFSNSEMILVNKINEVIDKLNRMER